MTERVCTTCGQPLTLCPCAPPPPPDTLKRVVALQRARTAALQWWAAQLAHDDPAIRAHAEAALRELWTADEATLAPWLKKQRRSKMDPITFYRLDTTAREEWRAINHREPSDPDMAAAVGVPLRSYRRYKRGHV